MLQKVYCFLNSITWINIFFSQEMYRNVSRPSPQSSPSLGGRHSAPCSPGAPSPLPNDYIFNNHHVAQFQQHFSELSVVSKSFFLYYVHTHSHRSLQTALTTCSRWLICVFAVLLTIGRGKFWQQKNNHLHLLTFWSLEKAQFHHCCC